MNIFKKFRSNNNGKKPSYLNYCSRSSNKYAFLSSIQKIGGYMTKINSRIKIIDFPYNWIEKSVLEYE